MQRTVREDLIAEVLWAVWVVLLFVPTVVRFEYPYWVPCLVYTLWLLRDRAVTGCVDRAHEVFYAVAFAAGFVLAAFYGFVLPVVMARGLGKSAVDAMGWGATAFVCGWRSVVHFAAAARKSVGG